MAETLRLSDAYRHALRPNRRPNVYLIALVKARQLTHNAILGNINKNNKLYLPFNTRKQRPNGANCVTINTWTLDCSTSGLAELVRLP